MAKVNINLGAGTINPEHTIVILESTEPSTFPNRYISGTIPGEIIFREIRDNQTHTYNVFVSDGNCTQNTSFDLVSDCVSLPSVSFTTNCSSYNPTDNTVQISATPQLSGASQVRLIIQNGNQVYANQLVPAGTATQVKVQANTSLSVRVEDAAYGGCSSSSTYVAECVVNCSYSISTKNQKCESATVASFDLTVNDQNPGQYTYSVKAEGDSTERFLTIVFGNVRFTPAGDTKNYIVSVTRSNCPARTTTFSLTCGSEGCNRLNATAYTLRTSSYTSFTDACSKYCNGVFNESTGYLTALTVGATVYSLATGCSTIADGYYIVVDSNKSSITIIKVQGGKITETQPPCNCANPTMGVDVNVQQPICSNGSLIQSTVYLTNGVNAHKYRLCEGTTFTCSNSCSDAPVITNGYVSFAIPAPAQGQTKNYVIRIYNTFYGCDVYRDYPITITSPICCVTYSVNTNSNTSTTVNYNDCNGITKSEIISGANTVKKICAQQGSLTTSGVATSTITTQGCDTSAPCSLSFQRTGFFCEDNAPKVRYTGNGGVVEGDYQIKVGNGNWVDFNQNRVHTMTGADNQTFNVQIRLKSNNNCIVNDTVTFTTNCTNTGTGCNKPTLSTQYLGTNNGVGYASPVDACENACNGRVQYGNYYSVNLNIGTTIYRYGNDNPNDCSTVGDGWYIGITNVYRVQNGIITEVAPHCFCGEVPTLNPSTITAVNGQTHTVNVGYTCTTSGIKIFKNGVEWKYLPAGTHSFTFNGNEVNNGDRLTAKTVCGDRQSGSSNEVTISKGGTVDPPQEQLCNLNPIPASKGYTIETFTYNINFNGTVFFMLSTGGIPDKLSVTKNGILINGYLATSWRTAGSINVNTGDVLRFDINGTVTGDGGTGWTFYLNCSTPYDVNANYNDQDRNNERPNVSRIDADCVNGQRRFIVNANPATATGSPVVQYKLLSNQRGAGDAQFNQDTGWQNSNILTQTITGQPIKPGQSYTVYIRDQAGKYFGISEVINNTTCTSTPTCDKSGLVTIGALWSAAGYPFGQSGEARNAICAGSAANVNIYPKGGLAVGNKVFINTDANNCNYVPNGWYVTPDANFNPSKIVRVIDSSITEIVDFTPCSTTGGCNKSGITKITLRNNLNGTPFSSCADANAKFCASQAGVIEAYLTGTSVGSKVYFNADLNNCSSIANGFYLNPDFSNAANSKIYGIFYVTITQFCNFNPC